MGYRSSKLDVAHTLPADGRFGDFYTAAVADNAFVTDFFVFSAVALPVLARSEYSLTEQTILFRL